MTAREVVLAAGYADTRQNRALLSKFLDSKINYADFPDAWIPGDEFELFDVIIAFSDYLDGWGEN